MTNKTKQKIWKVIVILVTVSMVGFMILPAFK
jgi:cytochrome c-type biogenesis protein CcmE